MREPVNVSRPPGDQLPRYKLPSEVVTCQEAATAKNIPLKNELKTLILTTGGARYALHVPGDAHASFRKVKKFLRTDEAYMLPLEELRTMGILPGEVSPVISPVWYLPHLISSSVLLLSYVSTNAGDRSTYFVFAPAILLNATDVQIGDFVRSE